MSIPISLTRIATAKADLKMAINSKGGTLTDELISEYADAVDALTPETFGNRVRFFDFDGTLLKTQYVATGAAATAPPVPTHDRMTFQTWNNMFSNVQSDLDVGAVYTTTTGNTEIDLHLTVITGKVQTFNIFLSSGTLTVDWGDGETSSINDSQSSQAVSHTYADYGDYTVELDLSDDASWYPYQYFGGSSDNFTMTAVRLTGVSNMATYAFSGQKALRYIALSNDVTTISSYAFSYSHSLNYIVYPSSLTTIADNTLRECYALSGFCWPASVAIIPTRAFYYCHKITDAVLPHGVNTIQSQAFFNCYGLEQVVLPQTMTTLSNGIFQYCYSLSEINLPEGIISAGSGIFYNCYALHEITIPSTMTVIPHSMFYYCYGLQKVTWHNAITAIGDSAFCYCNLADIELPTSLTSIGDASFAYNYRLKKIDFPENVSRIASGAFCGSYAITEYVLNRDTPPTLESTGTFDGINRGCLFKIPASEDRTVLTAYQTASNWSYYADYMIEKED